MAGEVDPVELLLQAERRDHPRHSVDTSANLTLIKTGSRMLGRILNLSLSGCRLCMEERFQLGIFARVETEFFLHGLPFRLGGVTQAIFDTNTVAVRFLDISDRRREQLVDLITEIAEADRLESAKASKSDSPLSNPMSQPSQY